MEPAPRASLALRFLINQRIEVQRMIARGNKVSHDIIIINCGSLISMSEKNAYFSVREMEDGFLLHRVTFSEFVSSFFYKKMILLTNVK